MFGLSDGALGAIGSVASSLIGGGLGYLGAAESNKEARKMQQRQMDFQQRMFQHRYQYQMADMKAAGLNPILAYSQGPPGGPAGSPPIQPLNELGAIGAELGRGVSTAIQARRMEADVKLSEEQAKAAAESVKNIAEDTKLKTEQRNVAAADWMLKAIQQNLTRNQANLTSAQTLKTYEETMMRQLEIRIAKEMEQIRKAESARGKTREDIYKSLPGKILTWIDEIGRSLNPFAQAGEKAGRLAR